MQTATDVADAAAPAIFNAVLLMPSIVRRLLVLEVRQGQVREAGHVIDAAAFNARGGDVCFAGEFDFHAGPHGDEAGQAALRANVSGLLVRDGKGWRLDRLAVESIRRVNAANDPEAALAQPLRQALCQAWASMWARFISG